MIDSTDERLRAVTPLLGFVLMLAIIMGFIGLLQSYAVPQWNKAVEVQHFDKLSYEISEIGSAVAMSSATGSEGKVVIDGGVKYPSRPFLISPVQSSTTVKAVRLTVTINGQSYTSYAIVVIPNYLYMERPTLIYEHSAVFEKYYSGVSVKVNQSSFKPGRINIYLINTTLTSISSTEPINLVFEPVSYGGVKYVDSVTISFESYDNETAKLWNETLNRIGYAAHRSGNTVYFTASNVYLSVSEVFVYASSFGEVSEELKPAPVSLENLSTDKTVFVGTTVPLGVRVLDKYGNPVRDVSVDVDVSSTPTSPDATLTSDDRGEVWYYFNAVSSGVYTVTFSIPSDTLTYTVTVNSLPGTGGGAGACIFSVRWIEGSDLTWDVSVEGRNKTIHYEVLYDGNPLVGAKIDLAQTNPNVLSILNPNNVAVTNSTGIADVYLNASSNGNTSIAGIIAGCVDVINVSVVNFTINRPPTQPTLTTDKIRYYVGDTIIATASGSVDPDGDPITYYYMFYDYTLGTILQSWSTTNTYTIVAGEDGHVIRVFAKACDDKGACSVETYKDVGVVKVVALYPTDDAFVDALSPSTNFGSDTDLLVDSCFWWTDRTFVKFDLSSIPSGSYVLNGTLQLYVYDTRATNRNYGAHRVTASWTESSITWDTQPSFSITATDVVSVSSGWLSWNVTTDVADIVSGGANYGWCIKDENENTIALRYSYMYSSEYSDSTYWPRLIVKYSPI